MLKEVALDVDQDSVVDSPCVMVVGAAVKLLIVGGTGAAAVVVKTLSTDIARLLYASRERTR
jgi:hypothetical protein